MNSKVQRRATRTTASSSQASLTVANGNGAQKTTDEKRRRRLRRKQKKDKVNKTMALVQVFVAVVFLVVISSFVTTKVKSRRDALREDIMDDDKAIARRKREEQMLGRHRRFNLNPGADNPPLGHEDDEKSYFQKLKSHVRQRKMYHHSDYMDGIGDKSITYAKLREEYDALLPWGDEDSLDRMKNVAQSLRENEYKNMMAKDMPYDIHDCPDIPTADYPYAWNVKEVLDNWAPDDPTPRDYIYQGLCVFDYVTEKQKAMRYREAELPFVVRNDPMVLRTVERWSQKDYMQKMVGKNTKYRTEYSSNNHFMYWMKPKRKDVQHHKVPESWAPPTEMMRMPYGEWLAHANVTDDSKLGPDMEHWYFRLIACGSMGKCDKDSSEYIFDELPFFQPRNDNELYMVEPEKQKGIHCRFGMKGVIAENHFDGSRNMIALLGGERRYILSHPDQCENLNLLPRGHPSARHSAVDWSNPDWEEFPSFKDAEVNEVVLQAGDVLYLPTNWFHYIISLGLNFQCNTRSGINRNYMDAIHNCGF